MLTKQVKGFDLDALCYLNKKRYPFLLESVINNDKNCYSILFAFPQQKIVLNDLEDFNFLSKLQSKINLNKNIKSDLPFSGGWFVYLSYELIGQIENKLKKYMRSSNLPIAYAVEIYSAIIVDHKTNTFTIVDQHGSKERIDQILYDIENIKKIPEHSIEGKLTYDKEEDFIKMVKSSIKYIISGDIFQINLSRKWQYELLSQDIHSAILYKALKKTNPAPFAALIDYEDFAIISSSPERLFSVKENIVETRPIAGTHPRGSGKKDDLQKTNLINNIKEKAEHIMILDLERNDMGKICEYGSVKANEIMILETYPYVHHIVSNIKGKLRKGNKIKSLVKAFFPGGTITGCPKVRCMQIISELEKTTRKAYTGSIGYISQDGKIDFNILIRTLIKEKNILEFRAGAGIVYDSIPEKELEETKHKAQGLIKIFK